VKLLLAIALLISSCSKAEEPFEPVSPTMDDRREYDQAVGRLVTGHVYGGFGVVSVKPDGTAEHEGEALIWGGTALWALPCDKGQEISRSMAQMVTDQGGAMIRVSPLGEYEGGREVTLDGALGLFLGVSRRIRDCGEADLWREPLRLILAFQEANGDRLHPNVPQDAAHMMFGEFKAVRDQVAYKAGLGSEPAEDRIKNVAQLVASWAAAVLAAHETGVGSDACYRVNLGLTSYLTLETSGRDVPGEARNQFCSLTKTMGIPTASHWCGEEPITSYLSSYVPDIWEFRHQRCSWESPDGKDNKSPELDRLVAMVMAFGWDALQ
jgi:hypothetical protein